jgi:spore germination cell wall hydrolase CwlJ-like protein
MLRRAFLLASIFYAIQTTAYAAPQLVLKARDRDALVRTLWAEARSESLRGQMAVCDVVFNRTLSTDPRFNQDTSIYVTCHRAWQFSGWKLEHPDRLKPTDPEYVALLNTVELAYAEYLHGKDYSDHATFYCTRHVHPAWLRQVRHTVTIGKHRFFKLR